MRRKSKKKSDIGVITLHWVLAFGMLVSISTGLRIMDPSGKTFGTLGSWLLPVTNIWSRHIWAGVSIIAFAAAYPFYLRGSGLDSRIRFDRARLTSLLGRGPARWGALGVLLYWALFGLLAIEIATGVPLYLGRGGAWVTTHRAATWLLVAFLVAHLACHFVFGGLNQLARVFRPVPGAIASAPHGTGPGRDGGDPATLLSGRARLALGTGAIALAAVVTVLLADRADTEVLPVARIARRDAPKLADGLSDAAWRGTRPLRVHTQQGANFGGTGETVVEVRALHDEDTAWFSFSWPDATRSLKDKPLVKTAGGWRVLRTEGDLATLASSPRDPRPAPDDEKAFSEDKFSVMLSVAPSGFGPGAFHAGERPLGDKPPSASGRGLHYRTDGRSVEVWLWHAASPSPDRQCEHLAIGRPLAPSPAQILGRVPYAGGIRPDPAPRPLVDNVQRLAVALHVPDTDPASADEAVVPLRLPRSLAASAAAMGRVNLDPDRGEPDGVRWAMTDAESRPYAPALDATVPVGTLIPGALAAVAGGDEASAPAGALRCAARWEAGRWTLIVSRRLDGARPGAARGVDARGGDAGDGDVRIGTGALMWVAAFDHASARHTRHMRPVTLELQ